MRSSERACWWPFSAKRKTANGKQASVSANFALDNLNVGYQVEPADTMRPGIRRSPLPKQFRQRAFFVFGGDRNDTR